MGQKQEQSLVFEIVKQLFVAVPLFLAKKVLLGIRGISDMRWRFAVYILVMPVIMALLAALKWAGGMMIHS